MSRAIFLKSAADPRGFPPDDTAEVAFVGRSNSGKSSAINAVTASRKLARVSKTPGRTQLINFFEVGAGRRIVDLPGYGFARVAPEVRRRWRGLLEKYLGERRGLRGIMITVDVRRGLKDLDRTMIDWAEGLGLPVVLLLTKTDKVSRNEAAKCRREVASDAPHAPAILFSAVTGQGVDEARQKLESWFEAEPREEKESPGHGIQGTYPGL